MEDFYSVLLGHFGYPINCKPTRIMYEAGLRAMGLNWRYLLVNVRRESLPGAIAGLRAFEMRGANLTMPLKTEVIPYLDALDDSARLTGAVNTILNEGGKLTGYNTDGQGQYDAMMQAGVDPGGKRMVLLGAGGAARAVGVINALHGAEQIIVVNRSRERGEAVAECIRAAGGSASFLRWEPGMALPDADIVVNATPVGLAPDTGRPDINYDSIRPGMVVSDAVMNPPRTPFLIEAERRGAKTVDGLSMLVCQGVYSVEIWTGRRPPAQAMADALRRCFFNGMEGPKET